MKLKLHDIRSHIYDKQLKLWGKKLFMTFEIDNFFFYL